MVLYATGQQSGEIIAECAHRSGDRHVVVVEDHQEVDVGAAGVVHRLIGHSGAHRPVADHGNDRALLALALGGYRHAEGRRRSVDENARSESVVLRFRHGGGKPAMPPHCRKPCLAAAGQDLVRIRLVTDVPHQEIARRIEDIMQAIVSSTVPRLEDKWPPVR
jgi:hypothetical protein